MLEGLEISILKFSELNDELRYESEFFLKRYLYEEHALARWKTQPLGTFASITDGPHGYHVVDEASPIAMLTAKCAKDWFSDRSSADTIASWVDTENKRSSLEENDIILSTRGTVGLAALVVKESLPANIDQDVARISWSDRETYQPEFIIAYLNSRFGQDRITRYSSGMVQQGLSLQKVREIPIPNLPAPVCTSISQTVKESLKLRRHADALLAQSEQLLLLSLGLENWEPPNLLCYIRSSLDAIERFDAEYFHPAKTAAQAFLQSLPGQPIDSMFRSVRELWQPENAPANEMVRNYDLNDALSPFLDNTKTPTYPAEIASTKKRLQKGDIVVSRLRSYLKEIAVVQTDGKEPMVCSTEFIVLRPKAGAIPVEALLVYLRSTLPQLIFKWSQDGSNHPRFDEKELLNLHVPDIVASISQELSDSVNAATRARQRATELLEAAKRAVEIAIEDSEAAALAYLKSVEEKPAP